MTATAKATSNTELATATLREAIFRGEYQPGTRLLEVPLSEALGISRTPLRQALVELEKEGLVERKSTTGYVVRSLTFADVCDAVELRGMLEGAAARKAAERGVPQVELDAMQACIDTIDVVLADIPHSVDLEAYSSANVALHNLIVTASGSRILREEIERAMSLPFSSPGAFLLTQREDKTFMQSLLVSQSQHRAVLDAITRREGARAEAIMREHTRIVRSNLEFIMTRDESLRRQVPGLSLVVD